MAGIENNLYPPIVDTYAPAFIYDSEDCKVYLNISQYNLESDINKNLVQVTVQDQNTNRSVLKSAQYPNGIKMAILNGNKTNGYYITISSNDIEGGFSLNTYYKVQIRFTSLQAAALSTPVSDGIDNWLAENLSCFSEWSSVVLIRGISRPTLTIRELNISGTTLKRNHFEINGYVSFESALDTEKLRKYWIEVYYNNFSKLVLLEQSGELISENNELHYIISSALNKGQEYVIKVQIETTNFYSFPSFQSYVVQISNNIDDFPQVNIDIKENNNKGCVTLDISNRGYKTINKNLLIGTAMNATDRQGWGSNNINNTLNWDTYLRYYNGAANIHTFTQVPGEPNVFYDTIKLNGYSTNNLGISFVRLASDIGLDPNSYYTLSCEAQCSQEVSAGATLDIGLTYYSTDHTKGSGLNGWVWRGGSNGQRFTGKNTWQKFSFTFKPDADTEAINYCFTVKGTNSTQHTWSIRKCKLEKGPVATNWIEGTLDPDLIEDYVFNNSNYTLIGSTAYFNFTKDTNSNDNNYIFSIKDKIIKDYDLNMGNVTLQKVSTGLAQGMYILIRRSSSRDNFGRWQNLGIAPVDHNNIQRIIWNDFTVQPGVFYKYAFIKCNADNDWLGVYQPQNKYMIDTWDIFISDEDRQLKISLDPQISNFSIKTNESVIETIGSQYPFIRRNNIINYKTFSLSGTISAFMDLGFNDFNASKQDLYNDSYNNYELYNSKNNVSFYNDFIYEKFFRQEVIKFLQKNNVKLFRSLTQGNMLVKLSNITFTPNITLGRRIYSFSCTVYEIANNSMDNINKYKIMNKRRVINK